MNVRDLDTMLLAAKRLGFEVEINLDAPQSFRFLPTKDGGVLPSEAFALTTLSVSIVTKMLGYMAKVYPEITCEPKKPKEETPDQNSIQILFPTGGALKVPLSKSDGLASLFGDDDDEVSYAEDSVTEDVEFLVAELNARVKRISNGNNYIRPFFLERECGSYLYHRCTHKSTVFRVATAYDPHWKGEGISGGSEYFFNLPEEYNDLLEFVKHDEGLYYQAHPEERPETV